MAGDAIGVLDKGQRFKADGEASCKGPSDESITAWTPYFLSGAFGPRLRLAYSTEFCPCAAQRYVERPLPTFALLKFLAGDGEESEASQMRVRSFFEGETILSE